MTGATGAESEAISMTEQAKAARREYKKQWAKNNPEKVKAQQDRYWTRKAAEAAAQQAEQPPQEGEPE